MPRWSYCTAPKPPTEDNALDELRGRQRAAADRRRAVGRRRPPRRRLRPLRPRGATATSGRAIRSDRRLLPSGARRRRSAASRSGCPASRASSPRRTAELSREYELRYAANQTHPRRAGARRGPRGPPHASVPLTASWPAVAAKTYLYFDQLAQGARPAPRVDAAVVGSHSGRARRRRERRRRGRSRDERSRRRGAHRGRGPRRVWLVLRDQRRGVATRAVPVTSSTIYLPLPQRPSIHTVVFPCSSQRPGTQTLFARERSQRPSHHFTGVLPVPAPRDPDEAGPRRAVALRAERRAPTVGLHRVRVRHRHAALRAGAAAAGHDDPAPP